MGLTKIKGRRVPHHEAKHIYGELDKANIINEVQEAFLKDIDDETLNRLAGGILEEQQPGSIENFAKRMKEENLTIKPAPKEPRVITEMDIMVGSTAFNKPPMKWREKR